MRRYVAEFSPAALADARAFVTRLRYYYARFYSDIGLVHEAIIADRYARDTEFLFDEIVSEIERCALVGNLGVTIGREAGIG